MTNFINDFDFVLLPTGRKEGKYANVKPYYNQNADFVRNATSQEYSSSFGIENLASNIPKLNYIKNMSGEYSSEILYNGVAYSNDLTDESFDSPGLDLNVLATPTNIYGAKEYSIDVLNVDDPRFGGTFKRTTNNNTLSIYALADKYDYIYIGLTSQDDALESGTIFDLSGTTPTVFDSTNPSKAFVDGDFCCVNTSADSFFIVPLDTTQVDFNNPVPNNPINGAITVACLQLNSGVTRFDYTSTIGDYAIWTGSFNTNEESIDCPCINLGPQVDYIENERDLETKIINGQNSIISDKTIEGVGYTTGTSTASVSAEDGGFSNIIDFDINDDYKFVGYYQEFSSSFNAGGDYDTDTYYNKVTQDGKAAADFEREEIFRSNENRIVEYSTIVWPNEYDFVRIVLGDVAATNNEQAMEFTDFPFDSPSFVQFNLNTDEIELSSGFVDANMIRLDNGFIKFSVRGYSANTVSLRALTLFGQNNAGLSLIDTSANTTPVLHYRSGITYDVSPWYMLLNTTQPQEQLTIESLQDRGYVYNNRFTFYLDIQHLRGHENDVINLRSSAGVVQLSISIDGGDIVVTDKTTGSIVATINEYKDVKLAMTYGNGVLKVGTAGAIVATITGEYDIDEVKTDLVTGSIELRALAINNENYSNSQTNDLTL